jgi:hypothetical protein
LRQHWFCAATFLPVEEVWDANYADRVVRAYLWSVAAAAGGALIAFVVVTQTYQDDRPLPWYVSLAWVLFVACGTVLVGLLIYGVTWALRRSVRRSGEDDLR